MWVGCASVSVLLLASPGRLRNGIAQALEWSAFFPVRAVLGWGDRSLLTQIENRRLRRELTAGRLEASRLRESARENEVLRRMLAMSARSQLDLTPARVLGRSLAWPGEVLWAEVHGTATPGGAVVTPDGLLGRTARVSGNMVWIDTLWHSRVAVSVVDSRSREQGILRWDPARPGRFAIDQIPLQADYRIGDPIVTSGLGEVFPMGILVGYVSGEDRDPRTQLKWVEVQPAARRARAQEVFLIREKPPEADGSSLYPPPESSPAGEIALPGGPGVRP
jgi:rod shape-determining protein MreC